MMNVFSKMPVDQWPPDLCLCTLDCGVGLVALCYCPMDVSFRSFVVAAALIKSSLREQASSLVNKISEGPLCLIGSR
jgi:hypothetical protein